MVFVAVVAFKAFDFLHGLPAVHVHMCPRHPVYNFVPSVAQMVIMPPPVPTALQPGWGDGIGRKKGRAAQRSGRPVGRGGKHLSQHGCGCVLLLLLRCTHTDPTRTLADPTETPQSYGFVFLSLLLVFCC